MSLDKHRESLVKYCYDISKVAFGVAVLNPSVSQNRGLAEVALGFGLAIMFFALAMFFERGRTL